MAVIFNDKIEVTSLTYDAWTSKDLTGSPYNVPSDASGVMLLIVNDGYEALNGLTDRYAGARKPGSTDDLRGIIAQAGFGHKYCIPLYIGCSSGAVEYYIPSLNDSGSVKLYLCGYFCAGEAEFYTNAIVPSQPSYGWQPCDLSSHISEGAVAAFWILRQVGHPGTTGYQMGLKKTSGSTNLHANLGTAGNSEVDGTDAKNYSCIQTHIATPNTRPITGDDWEEYWTEYGTQGLSWVEDNPYYAYKWAAGDVCGVDASRQCYLYRGSPPWSGLNQTFYLVGALLVGISNVSEADQTPGNETGWQDSDIGNTGGANREGVIVRATLSTTSGGVVQMGVRKNGSSQDLETIGSWWHSLGPVQIRFPAGNIMELYRTDTRLFYNASVYLYTNDGPATDPYIDLLGTTSITAFCKQGQNANPVGIYVGNLGGGTLNWAATEDSGGWIDYIDPDNGSLGFEEYDYPSVYFSTSGLAVGTHTATITITDENASNSPQTISVTLYVAKTLDADTNEDSTPIDWTPSTGTDHYAMINVDGDTKWNESNVSGDTDVFVFPSLNVPAGATVRYVRMVVRAKIDPDPLEGYEEAYIGTGFYIGEDWYEDNGNWLDPYAGDFANFGSYAQDPTYGWTTNPSTGNPWTVEEVNALTKFGYVDYDFNDNPQLMYVSRFYVEVGYSEEGGGLVVGSVWPMPCFCAASYSA